MDFWRKANEELSNIVDRIGDSVKRIQHRYTNHGMSTGEIKRRMGGVPIFRVSNYAEDVPVHVSGEFNLCFISKKDAKTFLDKLKTENNLPSDFRVIYNPLGDLLLNEENVIPIRLVPESSQIKNALQVKEKDNKHTPDKNSSFTGVPVFK
ncbi:hypothetical protein CASFOL_030608 [Castilleja foliolosa]|uniref:Uncharacterized protein n=1 Tax=Castilleja foliolosa TaxID=1961234 RepID=A0ABD3C6D7_9LAMI